MDELAGLPRFEAVPNFSDYSKSDFSPLRYLGRPSKRGLGGNDVGTSSQKGRIQLGSDADLVVFDPKDSDKTSANTHHMNIDYDPFERMDVNGRCSLVTVQGTIHIQEGQFVGKKGIGQILKQAPNH